MNSVIKASILSVLLFVCASAAFADGVVIYNNIPNPLPPSVPSLGYQANQTAEFGGLIQFAGSQSSYQLVNATVVMDNWTYGSQWSSYYGSTLGDANLTASGFTLPLTLNIYNVGAGNTVGSLINTTTVSAFIPWRPEPSPSVCAAGSNNDYQGFDGGCYAGAASTVTFDLTGVTVSSDQVIYGLAYNTETWGASPLGVDGPYDSLNFGLSTTPPSVGSEPLPDTAYWNTSTPGDYTDGGAGGVGKFRQDTNWTPYSGAIEVTATPEPSSLFLLGTGLLGLAFFAFRKAKSSRLAIKRIVPVSLAMAAALAIAPAAKADSWSWNMNLNGVSGSGTITFNATATPGVDQIVGMTGTITDSNAPFTGTVIGLSYPGLTPVPTYNIGSPQIDTPYLLTQDDLLYPGYTSPYSCFWGACNAGGGQIDVNGIIIDAEDASGNIWEVGIGGNANYSSQGGQGLYLDTVSPDTGGYSWGYVEGNYGVDTNFTASPEPGSLILLGTGLVGLAGMLRRKLRG